jgi:hypothetical protein
VHPSASRVARRHVASDIEVQIVPSSALLFHAQAHSGPVRVSGIDKLAWFADNPASAQLYLPPHPVGGVTSGPSWRIAFPCRRDEIQELQRHLGIEFDLSEVGEWGEDDAPKWSGDHSGNRVLCPECGGGGKNSTYAADLALREKQLGQMADLFSESREDAAKRFEDPPTDQCPRCYGSGTIWREKKYIPKGMTREVRDSDLEKLLRAKGFKEPVRGRGGWQVRRIPGRNYNLICTVSRNEDGSISPDAPPASGFLWVAKPKRPLRVGHNLGGGGYGANDFALFGAALERGLDGVQIYDEAQSVEQGNIGHYSVGIFKHVLRELRFKGVPARYHEWKGWGDTTTPEWPRRAPGPAFDELRRE